jgi:hypothetical protein
LVGPGLFFALALSAGLAAAEAPVGLDARGVDPAAAVDNPYGLDVRDQDGRPVTAAKVLSDLKTVTVARAKQATYASAVKQARALVSALELLEKTGAALAAAIGAFRLPSAIASAPAPSPKLSLLLMVLLAAVLPAATALLRCRRRAPLLLHTRQNRPEVLLC